MIEQAFVHESGNGMAAWTWALSPPPTCEVNLLTGGGNRAQPRRRWLARSSPPSVDSPGSREGIDRLRPSPSFCTTRNQEQGSHIMHPEVTVRKWKEAPEVEAGPSTHQLHERHSFLVQNCIGRMSERAYTHIAK